MSTNIEFNQLKEVYNVFAVQEVAWHKLGYAVNKAVTSMEAISLANLDFKVRKAQTYINRFIPDGSIKEIPNTFALVRNDNDYCLTQNGNTITKQYQVVQNNEAFNFFDNIVGSGEATYHTAGCLFNGEIIFITAKLPKTCFIKNDDKIDLYLLLTMKHDGRGCIKVKFTPIRVVCNNTLNSALKGGSIDIRHTGDMQVKLANITKTLNLISKQTEEVSIIYDKFANIRLGDKESNHYLARTLLEPDDYFLNEHFEVVFNSDISARKLNIMRNAINYKEFGIGQDKESCKDTLFGAYNTITGLIQNVKSDNNLENKIWSNEYGNNSKILNKAYNLALEYIQ